MFVANTYEELINMENIIFVDVRSEYEFEKETIPGAINIPI
ncbi:MAG: rhodanese-like domain-containing protein, partial [Finegoldia magna]|nr:rhodanese-like domain-containing protein [Finegoldia magna]